MNWEQLQCIPMYCEFFLRKDAILTIWKYAEYFEKFLMILCPTFHLLSDWFLGLICTHTGRQRQRQTGSHWNVLWRLKIDPPPISKHHNAFQWDPIWRCRCHYHCRWRLVWVYPYTGRYTKPQWLSSGAVLIHLRSYNKATRIWQILMAWIME